MSALNNFSTGRDVTLTIVTPTGPLPLSLITGFQSKQDRTVQSVKGIDGVPRHQPFFEGWTGSFSLDRQSSAVDDYFSLLEQNYYSGILEQPATITETIREVTGGVTQYQYIGVYLKLDDAGEWKTDSTVKQTLSFVASRRIKLA